MAALVSIIIPCYRQAHFLGQAIESALAQTYPDVEVLVVDDGSPDETRAVALRYSGVRYVEQKNAGVAAARNRGLAASRGEYVVFLDADDRLMPDGVALNAAYLSANPEAGFVAGRSYLIDSDGTRLAAGQPPPHPPGNRHLALLRRNVIPMPAMVMFRRSVFDRTGLFNSDVDACADYEMYLRVSRVAPVIFHDAIVAEYRHHDANMSLHDGMMLRQVCRVMSRERRSLRTSEEREAWREGARGFRDYYGDKLVNRLRARVRRGDWRRVATDAATLLKHHPRGFLIHVFRKLSNTARQLAGFGSDGDALAG